ncbi:phosphoenolpyruvate--protein phosphotransferase [Oharaeibacter diazotrophicus]|uniref:phosphoenolpyruvate--protein phosphotransferase n=1 Tax=Oharaeibacter diazotrophicus TaxID=1920512 RepID=A0A4R6R5Z8_9HYPH|nr:phosphoenolpyruvate--protein phosphotransferase [Oharaeibacter diazotrophicus]TDP80947.1 phosphotransferase system enzyme I (PtsP) [Oharaeibacter diazotrophicus]BBE73841.1 phosphoenolpyruvate-protein phosphotransferase [Pleomorphomonas sp. SM30]GLS74674.1 phosphoenolpyruvate--protein phosphotransferase [Oharaeibacter diazotrophicus]
MRGSIFGPRVLLRRLREVMAEPISAQARLDKIVATIAANMVAEVCSVYVLRADGVLELFATEGLNRTAVHKAALKVGEGLVGTIADAATLLNLPDAQAHPAFAYLPETGEEVYHSFLGVPILRAGRTLGVLVVQNRARKSYSDEEEEALQTTAMIIAEMIASGELATLAATPATGLDLARPQHLPGVALSDGVGLGHVVLHEPRVVVTNLIAEDPEKEVRRLDAAIAKLRLSVDDMIERGEVAHHGEHRDVLEAYRMFAYDRGWARRMEEAIVRSGLTAEAAVERVQSDTRARMQRQTDPYLRERLHDFDDLTFRLLRELMGRDDRKTQLPDNAIVVARNMGAAELLDYDRTRIRGLVLEEGAPTSHVAIVARALNIATVGQVPNAVSLAEPGDAIIVDGEAGLVHLRPPGDVESAYADKVRFRARRQERFRRLRNKPAVTRDGVEISLNINAGLVFDLPHLDESGADGIGLFRTELQFMIASAFPRMSEQQQLYGKVLDGAGARPVTFRSLDIGGDKVLPYLTRAVAEENPAMGWRAIRLGLDRPALLRTQVRALLKAAAGRHLRLMFPMVSEVDEFRRGREIVERELRFLAGHGYEPPKKLQLGAMIEVPALLFELDELLEEVDFVSVGSNDLFQFMFAADRGNAMITDRFDPLAPSFLRALGTIAEKARHAGKGATLCGELAGRPLAAMALIGIGFRSISMTPASVGPVKAMVRALDVAALEAAMTPALARATDRSLRGLLEGFAHEHDVPLT